MLEDYAPVGGEAPPSGASEPPRDAGCGGLVPPGAVRRIPGVPAHVRTPARRVCHQTKFRVGAWV